MKIDWLKPLLGTPGPFVTVYIDATRSGDSSGEVENRWKGLRRSLEKDGVDAAAIAVIEDEIVRPTRVGGPHGRVVIATADEGILVDRIIKDPPAVQKAAYGPVPELLQAARAADDSVDYLRVVVDRLGADLTWSEAGGHLPYHEAEAVEGGHDVVNKVRTGGLSHKRLESRAEDSWERNAEIVAAEIERQVVAHRPELILLTGDVRAVALLRGALGKKTLELTVDVAGGARGPGVNEGAFEAQVAQALDEFRDGRRAEALEEFREERGRNTGGISGLQNVVAVLARGQVRELLVADEYGPDTDLGLQQVWVGPEPLQLSVTSEGLEQLGVVEGGYQLAATVALVRAALGQDAGLTFVPAGSVTLTDGVGAVLRWHDESTPSDGGAPSLSSDAGRLRTVG